MCSNGCVGCGVGGGGNSSDKKFDNGRGLRVLLPVTTQKGTIVGPFATLASDVTQDIPQFTIHDFFPSIARAFCRLKPGHRNRLISELYISQLEYNKKPTAKHSA